MQLSDSQAAFEEAASSLWMAPEGTATETKTSVSFSTPKTSKVLDASKKEDVEWAVGIAAFVWGFLNLPWISILPFWAIFLTGLVNWTSKQSNEFGSITRAGGKFLIELVNFATESNDKWGLTDKLKTKVDELKSKSSSKQTFDDIEGYIKKAKAFVDDNKVVDQVKDISMSAGEYSNKFFDAADKWAWTTDGPKDLKKQIEAALEKVKGSTPLSLSKPAESTPSPASSSSTFKP